MIIKTYLWTLVVSLNIYLQSTIFTEIKKGGGVFRGIHVLNERRGNKRGREIKW